MYVEIHVRTKSLYFCLNRHKIMIFEGLHPFENNKADNLQEDTLPLIPLAYDVEGGLLMYRP